MNIYHIAPDGNDQNDGSIQNPLKTGQEAYRRATAGSEILLKAGERYTDLVIGDEYGSFRKSNIKIGRYGDGPNPLIVAAQRGGDHIRFQDDSIITNVIVENLDFRAMPPVNPFLDIRGAAISAFAKMQSPTLRNIRIQGYAGGINMSGENMNDIVDLLMENIIIRDTYARLMINSENKIERTHSGGIFLSKTLRTRLLNCIGINVGWIPESPLYIPTIYNQAFYMHASNVDLRMDGCIAIGPSAGGIQLRGNTQDAIGCMTIGCPVGIGGGNKTDFNSTTFAWRGSIVNCIVWNTDDVTPEDSSSSGRMGSPPHKPAIGIAVNFCDQAYVSQNMVVCGNQAEGNGAALQTGERTRNAEISNNILFDWKGSIVTSTHPTVNSVIRFNVIAGKQNQKLYSGPAGAIQWQSNRYYGGLYPESNPETGYNEYPDGIYYDIEYGVNAFVLEKYKQDLTERAAWSYLANKYWERQGPSVDEVRAWLASRGLADL